MKTQILNYKLLFSIVILLISTVGFAQQGINYQGVARDASNELLANADITLDLNIVKTSLDGETVYSENHTTITDANGVFSVVIGNGTPILNLFEDINWAEDKHFLNVTLNGVAIGTTEFTSVPYTQTIGNWQAQKNGVTSKGTGGSIYIGDNAGENDDFSDNNNIGFGNSALQNNNEGFENIALGFESLEFNTTGMQNIAIGDRSLSNNSEGHRNIAIGKLALHSNTIGENNIANGYKSLFSNISGFDNIASGYKSLYSNDTGSSNIANGYQAMHYNTIGNFNIANGYLSLHKNINGNQNVANGYRALYENISGNYNIANGFEVLFNNTIGNNNVAIGSDALYGNISGDNNIAVGQYTLKDNTEGGYNLALGESALSNNLTGDDNVALGASSLMSNETGIRNVSIGHNAGRSSKGNNNVFIGAFSGYNEIGGSNKLYISGNGVDNFPLIYGEFDNETLGFDAKVGIGTKNPVVPLHILSGTDVTLDDNSGYYLIGRTISKNLVFDNNEIQARENGAASTLYIQGEGGILDIGGQVIVDGSVVHASDRRLKRNIANISYGLKDILQLRPTEYFWKGKTQEHKSLGLIAQEVDEVIKNVVTYNKEQDKYGVSYTELIPVLIKAIQEQENTIQTLQSEVSELKASINNTSN